MPYIKPERRIALDEIDGISSPDTAGELNYKITKLMIAYCDKHGLNYQRINDCMGACQGAALEFYRRIAAPYERTRVVKNGDLDYYKHFTPGG